MPYNFFFAWVTENLCSKLEQKRKKNENEKKNWAPQGSPLSNHPPSLALLTQLTITNARYD